MTDRDRLIKLIHRMGRDYRGLMYSLPVIDEPIPPTFEAWVADYLLANGVIVQKQGEWKVHQNDGYWHYDCPFCDDGYATKGKDNTPPNYCGNCGAKLKELGE